MQLSSLREFLNKYEEIQSNYPELFPFLHELGLEDLNDLFLKCSGLDKLDPEFAQYGEFCHLALELWVPPDENSEESQALDEIIDGLTDNRVLKYES